MGKEPTIGAPVKDLLPNDRELLGRAARGDRLAFGQLYLRHVRPVYWQAYAVVRNEYDAEDTTQEVFITAWQKIAGIRVVDDSLLPWLLVTARYTALNKRRKSQRDAAHQQALDRDVADPAMTVEEIAAHDELLARVGKSVAALSEPDQQLYELCINGDRTYAEAADELGVTHGAVRNRVSRIRQRLRTDIYVLRGTS